MTASARDIAGTVYESGGRAGFRVATTFDGAAGGSVPLSCDDPAGTGGTPIEGINNCYVRKGKGKQDDDLGLDAGQVSRRP